MGARDGPQRPWRQSRNQKGSRWGGAGQARVGSGGLGRVLLEGEAGWNYKVTIVPGTEQQGLFTSALQSLRTLGSPVQGGSPDPSSFSC